MEIKKYIYFLFIFFLFIFFFGGGGGVRVGGEGLGGRVCGGQGGCEQRIEVFVKIQNKIRGGGGARVGNNLFSFYTLLAKGS